ncbi:hypothetical protein CV83915_2p0288 (plasmid) [Escherichia coli]|uniref:Uncharacterized protein n=1 Tax=Escherichia coli TaxID=562 RepID=A0A2H4TL60_ECOLX|nr:hypothetical protein CV83915_2p0288 [Escherichia coli]
MQPARKRAARHPAGIIRFIIIPEQLNQNGIYRCSGTDRMMFVSGYTCVTGNKCQCGQVNSLIVY